MGYYSTFINLLNQPASPDAERDCLNALKNSLIHHVQGDPTYMGTNAPVPMNKCIVKNNRGQDNGTFLHWAAKKGYTKLCKRMVELGFDINYQRETDRYTPLMIAAYYGDVTLANMLLSNGADANISGNNGTALLIASNNSEASINEACNKRPGRTPADLRNGRKKVHKILSPLDAYERLWNGFVSFLAGLTLIYPLAKTIQYFWKQHEEKQVKKTVNTYPGDSSNALPASWCEHYTAGLTFLGYRRPPAASIPSHTTAHSVHWSNPRPASS